jgi:hypothetical protein
MDARAPDNRRAVWALSQCTMPGCWVLLRHMGSSLGIMLYRRQAYCPGWSMHLQQLQKAACTDSSMLTVPWTDAVGPAADAVTVISTVLIIRRM